MHTFTVPAQALRSAMLCTPKKDPRYYLLGVCFKADGRIVGTDGHCLYVYKPNNDQVYFTDAGDIPIDRIVKVDGVIAKSAESIQFNLDTMIATTDKGKHHSFDYIDGTYPDIDRVIPALPRQEISSGFGVDPRLLAVAGAVFPHGEGINVYPGCSTEAITMISVDEKQRLIVMPCRTG